MRKNLVKSPALSLALVATLAGTAAATLPGVASAAAPSPYGDQPIDWQTVLVAGEMGASTA